MQRCRFCSRVLNPKAFSCTYCGKKTEREARSLVKASSVALPPLEYAGGVIAATGAHPSPQATRPLLAQQPAAPGDLDLAAFDAALAAAAQQASRRRWFRTGRAG